MMRLLLSLSLILVPQFLLAANTNPLMRICRIEQGLFWIVYIPKQELPLCFFDSAAIGAHALLGFKTGSDQSTALAVYKNRSASTCEQAGGITLEGRDSEKQTHFVCQFPDGSLIEQGTLMRGYGHPANARLDQALQQTY